MSNIAIIPSDSSVNQIGDLRCQLELGRWSISSVNQLLKDAWSKTSTSGERVNYIIENLLGTPFAFESNLPILPDGTLRVRLQDFDCITLVYYVLALSQSRDFSQFVDNLYTIRYCNPESRKVLNNPDTGNIFDFACDSILKNAVEKSFIKDITSHLVPPKRLQSFAVQLKRFQRPKAFDKDQLFVTPKYGEREVEASFITAESLDEINIDSVNSGDLVLFSRGPINKDGTTATLLIGHFAFIHKEDNELYFIHATRSYQQKKSNPHQSHSLSTGIFYDHENTKEQLGVSFGGHYLGDEMTLRLNGDVFHCFDQSQKRPLKSYFLDIFWGMKFFRVTDLKS